MATANAEMALKLAVLFFWKQKKAETSKLEKQQKNTLMPQVYVGRRINHNPCPLIMDGKKKRQNNNKNTHDMLGIGEKSV